MIFFFFFFFWFFFNLFASDGNSWSDKWLPLLFAKLALQDQQLLLLQSMELIRKLHFEKRSSLVSFTTRLMKSSCIKQPQKPLSKLFATNWTVEAAYSQLKKQSDRRSHEKTVVGFNPGAKEFYRFLWSFGMSLLPEQPKRSCFFFERFKQFRSMKTREVLVQHPKSAFARFCSAKYLVLVHPKMEAYLFAKL